MYKIYLPLFTPSKYFKISNPLASLAMVLYPVLYFKKPFCSSIINCASKGKNIFPSIPFICIYTAAEYILMYSLYYPATIVTDQQKKL